MNKSILIVGVLFSSLSLGADPDILFTILPDDMKAPGPELHFTVPAGHHFNFQAPNKADTLVGDKWQAADTISGSGTSLLAHFKDWGTPCAGVRAQLFVCDDKNTYCLPRSLEFKCAEGRWVSSIWKIQGTPIVLKSESGPTSFIMNSPDKAMKLARESHRIVLIDFYGIWCPPCNMLDETVFQSAEFKNLSEDFVLLKLDADLPTSWALKSQYRVTGYPTLIFATETGDEISRIIGYRPTGEFISLMNSALKNKDNSIEAKKVKAEKSDVAAYELGLYFLERQEFYLAHSYLLKASRHWRLPDIRRNKLMSAQLGVQGQGESPDDKRAYEKLLMNALEWYPRQPEVFDRAENLFEVAEELGDKAVTKQAYQIEVDTAQWYLSHPKALRGTDYVRGDLYEILGKGYESLDQKQESLDSYALGAKEYLRDIKRANLDEGSERGFNLERIYCLWRSGQVDLAQSLYENFEKRFPEEFTFFYQHAKLLKELKLFKEAEVKAQKAYDFSYGDNRLRVTALLAELYQLNNDKKKALEVLSKTIEHADLPSDKTIRTHRYFNKLVEMKKKIATG